MVDGWTGCPIMHRAMPQDICWCSLQGAPNGLLTWKSVLPSCGKVYSLRNDTGQLTQVFLWRTLMVTRAAACPCCCSALQALFGLHCSCLPLLLQSFTGTNLPALQLPVSALDAVDLSSRSQDAHMACKSMCQGAESSGNVNHCAAESRLWESEVMGPKVMRRFVEIDEVLAAERPLLADLRYVRLLAMAWQDDASNILDMKQRRTRGQADLEPLYHPLLLTMLQARSTQCVTLWLSCFQHRQSARCHAQHGPVTASAVSSPSKVMPRGTCSAGVCIWSARYRLC